MEDNDKTTNIPQVVYILDIQDQGLLFKFLYIVFMNDE